MSFNDQATQATQSAPDAAPAHQGHGPTLPGSGPGVDGAVADLQAQLHDLEVRYRGIIDGLPAVIYLGGVGADAPMFDVSPGVDALLGVSREEWLARPHAWVDRVHPDDRERVVSTTTHAAETGEAFRIEYRAIHRDSREVWIREDCVLICDEHGTPMYWLGLMLDVTDDAATRGQLHEARSKYGALVEQIPAIVYVDVADEQMTTTYVSPQIQPLLGYTSDEYVDDPDLWARMLHPDDRDCGDRDVPARTGARAAVRLRVPPRRARRPVLWFRDSAIVLSDADGEPALIQGVMLDITERKAAEKQIAYLAYHDKLTGMANRAMFDELLGLSLVARPPQRHAASR